MGVIRRVRLPCAIYRLLRGRVPRIVKRQPGGRFKPELGAADGCDLEQVPPFRQHPAGRGKVCSAPGASSISLSANRTWMVSTLRFATLSCWPAARMAQCGSGISVNIATVATALWASAQFPAAGCSDLGVAGAGISPTWVAAAAPGRALWITGLGDAASSLPFRIGRHPASVDCVKSSMGQPAAVTHISGRLPAAAWLP